LSPRYRTPTERNQKPMMKHSLCLLVAAIATSTLAGCQLYFGEDNDSDSWTYCGQDGYYECNEEDCYWRGPECPSGSSMGTPPGGFECDSDADCAAGCYCGNGVCEEAGFCTQDSDCGAGYVCDEQRSSCTPGNTVPPTSCGADNDCPAGAYCNPDTLKCEATCSCMTDEDAVNGGFAYCDEARNTCLPGADPNGDCAGEVTCNLGRPVCPEGQVALISDGCYTGQCQAINQCGADPGCSAYGYATDCSNAGCQLSYTGINCRAPDNTPCTVPSASCTCQSYQFASCSEGSMPRVIIQMNGQDLEVPQELILK